MLDCDDDGTIDSGRELFGADIIKLNGAFATPGFDALSDPDCNGDHAFNQSGDELLTCRSSVMLTRDEISSTAHERFSLPELEAFVVIS